ncbi:MAG: YdjY domain-containing protein [Akkermansiaceae bacterium]
MITICHRNSPIPWILMAMLGLAPFCCANPEEAVQPMVKQTSPNTYQIGIVSFNKETRELVIPANTNITEPNTVIEYLLIHDNGEKIHESLLTTQADPFHINIAIKLLNYQESPELFKVRRPDGSIGKKYPEVSEEIKAAARFRVLVSWMDGGTEKTIPVTEWIHNASSGKNMNPTAWVYNGSFVYDKKFNAKLTGSILAIFSDIGAIANYSGDDRNDDTLWSPSRNVPPAGTPVKVILKPWIAVQ